MKKPIVSAAFAASLLAFAPSAFAHPGHRPPPPPLTIAVYGDAPYGTNPTDVTQTNATPAFIDAVNADANVSLVMHVGDIHSGKQYCTEAYDRNVAQMWTRFQDPLVYTPGDNEWSDCHKVAEGGGLWDAATGAIKYVLDASGNPVDYASGDPVANLDLVRSIFFAHPGRTLGGGHKLVLSQGVFFDWSHPEDADFVENVIWVQDQVLFVTLDIPGGSNNDQDVWYGAPIESAAQTQERVARTAADRRWLAAAFALAHFSHVKGVVIMEQADMWDPEKGAAHQAGYEPFVSDLAQETAAFGGPVLLLNGDSHVFRSDNPLSAADPLAYMHPGHDVANFHRIVVHGSTLPLEYLRLIVDPTVNAATSDPAFGPFRWERVIE